MNPLRRIRKDRRNWTAATTDWTAMPPAPAPPAHGRDAWCDTEAPLALPQSSVYVAVPPEDLGEVRLDVAIDLAAFYNTLREGEISDDHALALTQAFFPRGRWG